MATFVPGQDIRTPDPTIEVTVTPQSPLPPGRHRFQLVGVLGGNRRVHFGVFTNARGVEIGAELFVDAAGDELAADDPD